MEWEATKAIIFLLGGVSTFLGIIVLVQKPSREEQREQRLFNEKQQDVLNELQITIAKLNVTLNNTNELDIIRDKKLGELDERSWGNYMEIEKIKNTTYTKKY